MAEIVPIRRFTLSNQSSNVKEGISDGNKWETEIGLTLY